MYILHSIGKTHHAFFFSETIIIPLMSHSNSSLPRTATPNAVFPTSFLIPCDKRAHHSNTVLSPPFACESQTAHQLLPVVQGYRKDSCVSILQNPSKMLPSAAYSSLQQCCFWIWGPSIIFSG